MNTKQLLMSAAIGTAAIFGLNSCGDKKETGTNSTDAEKVLVITAIPDEKISDQEIKYKALADYLSKKLDIGFISSLVKSRTSITKVSFSSPNCNIQMLVR